MAKRLKVRLGRRGLLVRLPTQMVRQLNLKAGQSLSLTLESDGSYRLAKMPVKPEPTMVLRDDDEDDQYEYELPLMPGVVSLRRAAEFNQQQYEQKQKKQQEQEELVARAKKRRLLNEQAESDAKRRKAHEVACFKPRQPAPYRMRRPEPAPEPCIEDPEPEMEL